MAQTLQHSLMAEDLPHIPGIELAARYVAGVEGIDIGGDWYDVIPNGSPDDTALLGVRWSR